MDREHSQHVPVMLEEVLNFLQPSPGGLYIDGTLGAGGHTRSILERSDPDGRVLGIDADAQALVRVRGWLSDYVANERLLLVQRNFAELRQVVDEVGMVSVQGVLLDLGFSSNQMDDPQRGFSFRNDGPLDMRLDQSLDVSAADLVNEASEQDLADIFWRYGEETRSRQVARRIVRERTKGVIDRTSQLAVLVAAGVPYKPGAIHPATRVFQALRIAVNHELERLTTVLPQILEVLGARKGSGVGEIEGGRMVIITFHSLEDRIVKEFMRREAKDCLCPPQMPVCICNHKARLRLLTPKPLVPTSQEIAQNPRARSAKLRAAELIIGS